MLRITDTVAEYTAQACLKCTEAKYLLISLSPMALDCCYSNQEQHILLPVVRLKKTFRKLVAAACRSLVAFLL